MPDSLLGDLLRAAGTSKHLWLTISLAAAALALPPSSGRAETGRQPTPMPRSEFAMKHGGRTSESSVDIARLPRVSPQTRQAAFSEPVDETPEAGLPTAAFAGRAEPSASFLAPASLLQPMPQEGDAIAESFGADTFLGQSERLGIGIDLYSAPDFEGGLIIYGTNVAMKIGGYVKADFIYDFDPIDATDSFVTTTIPVGAPPRTNARFHARQTRLSFDTRWKADEHTIRIYVEGDFFSADDQFRLRHAYGEVGSLLVGRTWTTFTDVAAAPDTLDFEGSVSSVSRRQAQARWTRPILSDDLTMALAVEDTQFIVEPPVGITGDERSPSPDFVVRLRLDKEWGQFQVANLHRIGGFQPTGESVITDHAWGFNFTGAFLVRPRTKAYYQIVFGEGIGSYRGLPDAAPTTESAGKLIPLFGWMVGVTHEWRDGLSSNFTYAENSLDNTPGQAPDDVHRTTYLAANLIWSPWERTQVGIEYLYGTRENVDGGSGEANRLQMAFIFDLP